MQLPLSAWNGASRNALDLVRAAIEPVPTRDQAESRKHNIAVWGSLMSQLRSKPAQATVHGVKLVLDPLGSTDLAFMYVYATDETRDCLSMYAISNTLHGFYGDEICVINSVHSSNVYEPLALPANPTPTSVLRVIFADAAKRLPSHKAQAAAEPQRFDAAAELENLFEKLNRDNHKFVLSDGMHTFKFGYAHVPRMCYVKYERKGKNGYAENETVGLQISQMLNKTPALLVTGGRLSSNAKQPVPNHVVDRVSLLRWLCYAVHASFSLRSYDSSRLRVSAEQATAAAEPETDTKSGKLLVQAINAVYEKLEIVAAPFDRKLTLVYSYVDMKPPQRDVYFDFTVPGIPRPGSEHDRSAGHYQVLVRNHKFSLNGRDGYGTLLELPAARNSHEATQAAVKILEAVAEHRSRVLGLTHTLRRRDNQATAAAEPQAHRKDAAFAKAVQIVRAAMAKEPKRVRTLEVPRISGPVKIKVRLAMPRVGSRRGAGLNEDGMLCFETTWLTAAYTAYASLFNRHDESVVVTFQIKGRKHVDLDMLPTPTRPSEVLPFLAKLFVDQLLGPDRHQEAMELTAAAEPGVVRNVLATMPAATHAVEKGPLALRFSRLSGNDAGEGTEMLFCVQDSRYVENSNVVPDVFFKVSLGPEGTYTLTSSRVIVVQIPATSVRSYQQLVNLVVPHAVKYAARILASRARTPVVGNEVTAAVEPPASTGRMSISFRGVGRVSRSRACLADLKTAGVDATLRSISDRDTWVSFRIPTKPENFKAVLRIVMKHHTDKHPLLIFTGRGCYGVAELPGNAREIWEAFKSTTSEADA